jgi:hypothetical protein
VITGKALKANAAAQRSSDRRQREDDALRLRAVVPALATLQIEVVEESGSGSTKHRKHIVVERAPALFDIVCGDPRCEHGGHDITHEVMRALHGAQHTSESSHDCAGSTGSAPCTRRISYRVYATYTPAVGPRYE